MWARGAAWARRDPLWVTAVFLLLTMVLAYPLSLHPASMALPLAGDTRLFLWTLGWDVHALTSQPWALFDANIFAPERLTLAYSENCFGSALVAAPFLLISRNPVLAMNAVVLIACILCGTGTYALARQLGVSRAGSVLAGMIFAFAPPRFLRLGQLHLATVQWVPFCLAYVHRYLQQGRARDVKIAAALFTFQVLTSGHGGLFLIVALVCLAGWRLIRREPLHWRRLPRDLGMTGAACFVLLLLFLIPYQIVQREQGLLRTLQEARDWSPNLASYLSSPSAVHKSVLSLLPEPAGKAKAVLFPGILPLLLAPAGVWVVLRDRGRRHALGFYLVVLVVAFWLSLGPDYGLYSVAYKLPAANFIRVPSRYVTLALLGLAVLAAAGFDALTRRLRPRGAALTAGVLVVLLALEFNMTPLNAIPYRVDVPGSSRWLAQQQKPFTVVEVPVFSPSDYGRAGSVQSLYMLHSMGHWQKTVNGYSGYEPPLHTGLFTALVNFPDQPALDGLSQLEVDYVVVNTTYYHAGQWEQVRARLSAHQSRLKLVYVDKDSRVYAVRKPGP